MTKVERDAYAVRAVDGEPRGDVVELGARRSHGSRQRGISAELQRRVSAGAVGEARAHEDAHVGQVEIRIARRRAHARANAQVVEVAPEEKRRIRRGDVGAVRREVAAMSRHGRGAEE